jgi:DNA-binding NarL/FixJ family response regulator
MISARILLVDDEPGIREAVQAYLEEEDFAVEVASDAQEGWEKLQRSRPDLVITDVMMPRVDGYEFLRQMREDDRFKSLPVVFLTARGMTSDRIQGYDAGCDAYLAKPFDPDELVSIVTNLLKRRATVVNEMQEVGSPDLLTMARHIEEMHDILLQRPTLTTNISAVKIDLTPREQSVLNLVAKGLMNKEIARDLDTSVRNVEKYVSRLFSKTGTNSRTELVRYALEHGLVTD